MTTSVSYVSAKEALQLVQSGQRVFVQGASALPQVLVDALTDEAPRLRGVEIVHLHTDGKAPYLAPGLQDSFHLSALFTGGNAREAIADGRADYIPVFLSEVPGLFRKQVLPLDVALVRCDALRVTFRHRVDAEDAYFASIRQGWSQGLRKVFNELPGPDWLKLG